MHEGLSEERKNQLEKKNLPTKKIELKIKILYKKLKVHLSKNSLVKCFAAQN